MNWKLHHSNGRNIWRSFKMFGKHSKIWFCWTEMIPPPPPKKIHCVHNQRWQHLKTPTTGALQYIQPRRKCWKLQIKWLKMLIQDYFMLFKTSKRKKKNTLRSSYMKPGRLWFMSQKSHLSLQTWKLQCRTGQRPLNSMRLGSTGSQKFNIKQSDLSWQMGEYRLAK